MDDYDIDTSRTEFMLTRRRDSLTITRDMVLSSDADLDTVMDYADELEVDLGGLNSVEEMRCRLCMHLDYQELKENAIHKILKLLSEKHSDDSKRRRKLRELLQKFLETNKNFNKLSTSGKERIKGQATLESLLQTEGITKDLAKDLSHKTDHISTGHCVVVVAGETNAGKSTFLNLLLDTVDLLTVKAVSCTSVITRISYGKDVAVSVQYESGRKEDIALNHGVAVGEQIEKLLFEKDLAQREVTEQSGDQITEVHLRIPSVILKCGLVLVDSPGIGENPVMDRVIHKFVANNEIHGFIYLIKSNSGSRVDEDRLGDLLKMIITSQKERKSGGSEFDPRLALFVCNHWDELRYKREEEEVFRYIVTRLQKYWPGLKTDQVIKFSALEARREMNQNENYITPDYKALWEGIHELYVTALDKRVTSTYKWMETILKRMTHHLKTFVHRLDSSEESLHEKLSHVETKLQRLNSRAEDVFRTLSDKIDKASEDIFQSFKEHLMTHPSKTGIVNWVLNETPEPDDYSNWDDLKMEIYERTSKRISRELVRWEEKEGHIVEIERTIHREINMELNLLKEELNNVDDELDADNQSITSNETERNFGTLRKRNSGFGHANLPSMMVDTENQLSVPLIAQILSPLGNAFQNLVSGKNRMGEYVKNRTKVTREKSRRYYDYVLNTSKGNDFLRKFVDNLLEQSREKLSDIRDRIPAIINANREVLEHILRCRKDTSVSIELYEEMMHGLEDLKQQLTEYGEGEIFVDDFRNADIRISINSSGSQSIRISNFIENSWNENTGVATNEIRALWTILQNGSVRKEDEKEETPVFLRIYMTSSGVTNITSEVSKLRFLKHQHVAEFLGLHRAHVGFPALIYKDKMRTLREYLKNRSRDGKDRVRIFLETVKGLDYLHRRRLVHMELNTHTITLDRSTDKVSLTGACLPRKANLPMDRESVEVSHFVFISPEVLNDEAYLSCDDSYAVGLLALELIFKQKPYKEYRSWSLDQFAREVNPESMLKLNEALQGQPKDVSELIARCFGKADDRPAMDEFMKVKLPVVDRMRTVEEENPVPVGRLSDYSVPSRV